MINFQRMELHEEAETGVSGVRIMRVPGGWIYSQLVETGTGGYSLSSCFVPYSCEFTRNPIGVPAVSPPSEKDP